MAQGWQPLITLEWKNKPNTTTPLSAANLNDKVSALIGELDSRTRTLDSVKLDVNDATGYVSRCETAATNAEASAGNAATSKANADAAALVAEGYANGKQNGVPVGSSSPYYHNNAEFFKDQASQIAAQQLGSLTDVQISNPTNGQVLTFDETSQKWINGQSGGSNLNDLEDVDISSPANWQALVYDSTTSTWKNKAFGSAARKNIPTSGDASTSQVVMGSDTRLTDARTPTAHTHAASDVTAGTLAGQVVANATAVQTLNVAQVRNIYAGTEDMTPGTTDLATGTLYIVYE